MFKIRYLLLGALCLSTSTAWSAEAKFMGGAIEVEDGDTLLVTLDGETKRIQLSGIDAPEERENPKYKVDRQRTGLDDETLKSLGLIATEHLRKLLRREQGFQFRLRYTPDKPDRYGRIPGELFTESGVSINQRMVSDGYAIALPSAAPDGQPYASLQQQARQERVGLWGMLYEPTLKWSGMDAER